MEIARLDRSLSGPTTSASQKYFIKCPRVTNEAPTTQEWLTLSKGLKGVANADKVAVIQGLVHEKVFSKAKEVVVKLMEGHAQDIEYYISKRLAERGVVGAIKFICKFSCADDHTSFGTPSGELGSRGPGSSMRVVVMPFYSGGSLKSYADASPGFSKTKSLLKQAVASIAQAFAAASIVMKDRHSDNFLVKRTPKSVIEYQICGRTLAARTEGVRIMCMDFEFSIDYSGAPAGAGVLDMFHDVKTLLDRFDEGCAQFEPRSLAPLNAHVLRSMIEPDVDLPNFVLQTWALIDAVIIAKKVSARLLAERGYA